MEDLTKLTDEKVVEYIRTHDQEAYQEVVTRYQDKLMRYARRLTQDETVSEDVVQNALVKAFVNLNGFNTKMKFSSWIYRIVHNEAMNTFAKQKHEVRMPEGIDFESDEDIELNFTKEEEQERVERCMSHMPLLYFEPLSLFFIEGKSYKEIGDILRIPVGTVGTRVNRGKVLMKKI